MDTIFAVSSGAGRSAIAVIRLSGPHCADTAAAMCGQKLRPRDAHLVRIRDPASQEVLDHAIGLYFAGPASFTGEDCLEFHVHGGHAVVQSVLRVLASRPHLRAAQPGEFTRRAFHHGKLDLDSVEGLADLIQADTVHQQRQALSALSGSVQRQVVDWRSTLVGVQARLEAWLDFPDESDVSDILVEECRQSMTKLAGALKDALRAADQAEIIRDGVKVLIAGPPNAGKSSLLNRLVQRDAAIVAGIPGTTRDLIEVRLDIGGIPVSISDGAGIRDTTDVVEQLGIDRVKAAARQAQIIIWLTASDELEVKPPDWAPIETCELLVVSSKVDLNPGATGLGVSVVTDQGIDELISRLGKLASGLVHTAEDTVQLRQRHSGAAREMLDALESGLSHLHADRVELAAEECRRAMGALALIAKPIHSEDILGEVFSRFCIGK